MANKRTFRRKVNKRRTRRGGDANVYKMPNTIKMSEKRLMPIAYLTHDDIKNIPSIMSNTTRNSKFKQTKSMFGSMFENKNKSVLVNVQDIITYPALYEVEEIKISLNGYPEIHDYITKEINKRKFKNEI